MDQASPAPGGPRRDEDIALDLLKFVAASGGAGRAQPSPAGFVPSPAVKPEDQVNHLLDLYAKCLRAVRSKGEGR